MSAQNLAREKTDLEKMILPDIIIAVKKYLDAARSPSTRAAYKKDWQTFIDWCEVHNIDPLPASPATVALYATSLAEIGRKVSSISRAMTSINQAHRAFKCQPPNNSPEVIEVMKGIKRTKSVAQKKAKPLLLADLKKVIWRIIPSFLGKRDRALLLVGWAAALRRSEIVSLNVEDIDFVPEGATVTIRRSKTDQIGEGVILGLPLGSDPTICPTTALKGWIEVSGLKRGTLFPSLGNPGKGFAQKDLFKEGFGAAKSIKRLTARSVNIILDRRLESAGFSSRGFSGHSLRAGYISTAAKAKIPEYAIQMHTRHRSTRVLLGYMRGMNLFEDNPLAALL